MFKFFYIFYKATFIFHDLKNELVLSNLQIKLVLLNIKKKLFLFNFQFSLQSANWLVLGLFRFITRQFWYNLILFIVKSRFNSVFQSLKVWWLCSGQAATNQGRTHLLGPKILLETILFLIHGGVVEPPKPTPHLCTLLQRILYVYRTGEGGYVE